MQSYEQALFNGILKAHFKVQTLLYEEEVVEIWGCLVLH